MYDGLLEYLLYFIPFVCLVGCLIGAYYYRKLTGKSKLILLYLSFCLIFDLIGRVLVLTQHNNLILVPVFGFLELFLFSWIYHQYMLKRNRLLIALNLGALILILIDCTLENPFQLSSFHSIGRIIDGFFILILCLAYFYEIMVSETSSSRTKTSFNVVTFLFFTINSLWFLVVNFLITTLEGSIFYLWVINVIATPLFYLYLTVYLWKNRTQPTS